MEQFGPYWLFERLAVGGMAELFLGHPRDELEAPPVVVKRILPEHLDRPDFVEMFLDEVRISSLLHHKNIVQVLDLGEVGGVQFVVLEYVDGASLADLLRFSDRLLTLPLACWIVAETCAGLGYAHGRTVTCSNQPLRIVHRDISPHNILLSTGGTVKVADFGVAKASVRLTRSDPGQLKGKYAYMSPEQVENAELDSRSDIFSVGAVLYECTTGSRLFGASNPSQVLEALKGRRYTPPEQRVPAYPPRLASIVNRALRWNPDERYQDALEMQHELMELVPPGLDLPGDLAALVQRCRCEPGTEADATVTKGIEGGTSGPTRSG